jgi:hypothetical protein
MFARFAAARSLLVVDRMSSPQELSLEVLNDVRGGKGLIEGARKLYNAGVVAWQVLNPSHKPPPRIPEPPRIERPAPTLPGPRRSPGGGGGADPQP